MMEEGVKKGEEMSKALGGKINSSLWLIRSGSRGMRTGGYTSMRATQSKSQYREIADAVT